MRATSHHPTLPLFFFLGGGVFGVLVWVWVLEGLVWFFLGGGLCCKETKKGQFPAIYRVWGLFCTKAPVLKILIVCFFFFFFFFFFLFFVFLLFFIFLPFQSFTFSLPLLHSHSSCYFSIFLSYCVSCCLIFLSFNFFLSKSLPQTSPI